MQLFVNTAKTPKMQNRLLNFLDLHTREKVVVAAYNLPTLPLIPPINNIIREYGECQVSLTSKNLLDLTYHLSRTFKRKLDPIRSFSYSTQVFNILEGFEINIRMLSYLTSDLPAWIDHFTQLINQLDTVAKTCETESKDTPSTWVGRFFKMFGSTTHNKFLGFYQSTLAEIPPGLLAAARKKTIIKPEPGKILENKF